MMVEEVIVRHKMTLYRITRLRKFDVDQKKILFENDDLSESINELNKAIEELKCLKII